MALKHNLKVARGTRDKIINSTDKLLAGEMLYNTTDNYLTIAKEDQQSLNSLPIDARRIHGWISDNLGVTTDKRNEYEIAADNGGIFIKSPIGFTLKNKNGNVLTVEDSGTVTFKSNMFSILDTQNNYKLWVDDEGMRVNTPLDVSSLTASTITSGAITTTGNIDCASINSSGGIRASSLYVENRIDSNLINADIIEASTKFQGDLVGNVTGDLTGNAASATTAGNATLVQNVDFSDDTIANFNGMVVEKKQLLYGLTPIDVYDTAQSVTVPFKVGDTIELVLTSDNNDNSTVFFGSQIIRFKVKYIGDRANYLSKCYQFTCSFNSSTLITPDIISIDIYTVADNTLWFFPIEWIYYDRTDKEWKKATAKERYTVSEIYKIIY